MMATTTIARIANSYMLSRPDGLLLAGFGFGDFSLHEVQDLGAGAAFLVLLLGPLLPDRSRGGNELVALRFGELRDLELLLEDRQPLGVVLREGLEEGLAGKLLGLRQLGLEVVGQLVPSGEADAFPAHEAAHGEAFGD